MVMSDMQVERDTKGLCLFFSCFGVFQESQSFRGFQVSQSYHKEVEVESIEKLLKIK